MRRAWSFRGRSTVGRRRGDPQKCLFERDVAFALRDAPLDVVDRAVHDALAVLDDGDAVAELLDEIEQVRAEDHRGAFPGATLDRLFHAADAERIEAGERLRGESHLGRA